MQLNTVFMSLLVLAILGVLAANAAAGPATIGGEVQLQSESEDPTRLDWRREGIGLVSHFAASRENVYVGSESGVVASVSKADGSINWRRVLNKGTVDALVLKLGMLVTVSDHGRKVNFFKAKDGSLKAASATYSALEENANLQQLEGAGGSSGTEVAAALAEYPVVDLQVFAVGGSKKGNDHRVAVLANNGVFAYGLDGKQKWAFDGNSAEETAPCSIQGIEAGSASVQVTCSNTDTVYSLDSKLGGWTIVDGSAGSKQTPTPSGASRADLSATAATAFAEAVEGTKLADRATAAVMAAFPGAEDGELGVQLVDGGFAVIDSDGQLSFLREEGLSLVSQVVPVALDRQTAAQVSSDASQNQLSGSSLAERLASHATILADFAASLPSEFIAIIRGQSSGGATSVDRIGGKLLVALSQRGRVFALDSVTGAVRWSRSVAPPATRSRVLSASVDNGIRILLVDENVLVVLDLLTGAEKQREAAGVGAPAVETVLHVALLNEGSADNVDPTCGDGKKGLATIAVHSDGSVSVLGGGSVAAVVESVQAQGKLFFQNVDMQEGIVSGHVLEAVGQELRSRQLWSLPLGDSRSGDDQPQSLLEACATVDSHEKIQVLGLPFSNDGVLLKYLNPNMMACAVSHASTDSLSASVDVVVLDTVTGRSLYRIAHENSAGPVQMVFSENFLVYTYSRVDNAARTEIGSIALYESSLGTYDLLPWKPQDRKESFSSFDEQMPVVLQKSFTYPEGILRLAVSQTAQGVSEKAFLVHTSAGRVAFLRRDLLDPRRPDLTVPGAKPDPSINLKPYHGHLAQIPTDIVSYHLDLRSASVEADGTHHLQSFPTKLESTAEVFLTGLDLFYARFAPSTTYDMLPEGFQKQIIVIVAVGVSTATALAHRMALQKNLKTVWK